KAPYADRASYRCYWIRDPHPCASNAMLFQLDAAVLGPLGPPLAKEGVLASVSTDAACPTACSTARTGGSVVRSGHTGAGRKSSRGLPRVLPASGGYVSGARLLEKSWRCSSAIRLSKALIY